MCSAVDTFLGIVYGQHGARGVEALPASRVS